jgi:hypothetical protein
VFAIYLDVGFESQLSFGRTDDPASDPKGCWYASVNMLGHYFEYGPRLGNPALYKRNLGTFKDGTPMIGHDPVSAKSIPVLMQNEHLVAVPSPDNQSWNTADLAQNLRTYGPLIFFWFKKGKNSTYGHVSVLIGADSAKKELVIHDPENRPNFHMSTADFNAALAWDLSTGCILRREDAEFLMKGGLHLGAVTIEMET